MFDKLTVGFIGETQNRNTNSASFDELPGIHQTSSPS